MWELPGWPVCQGDTESWSGAGRKVSLGQGAMGNSRSRSARSLCSRFLPEEQAEIDRLFDALSSAADGAETPPRSFSLKALQSHVGEALPPEMVSRLYDSMWWGDPAGRPPGPSGAVSREQFSVWMWRLLRGSSEEKSPVVLSMISAAEGPVKAREVQKFAEDLVDSVVHVLTHRQELRGWAGKATGAPVRTQALAAQLVSEMKLPGGERPQGPQWLDSDCDRAVIEDWVFRVPHVALFLRVVIHGGLLVLRGSLDLATLVPERQVEPGRELESLLDVLTVIFLSSHLTPEQRQRWRLLFASHLHGQSFSQLCGRVTHRGPCLALLEDRGGHVFGGFSSCSWEVKPQFQGQSASPSCSARGVRRAHPAVSRLRLSLASCCSPRGLGTASASCSPSPPAWLCTHPRATTTTTCTSTMGSRPSPMGWAWEGSMATSGYGWMPTSGTGTARPSPRVPRTTARSCLPRRTSGLRRWRCGQSETPQSQSWPRVRRVCSTLTPRRRLCWRLPGGRATAKASGKPQTATVPPREQLDVDALGYVEHAACWEWVKSSDPLSSHVILT
ncbi:PREDICTED: TLD domain-containing protein 1 isoform X2 [Chinchilla lanigera]|uniref:TLD domain-containing protein 1 isoform X2 n=1 Tax=Chinchilla lanigera TaxID=34839 RepID=UPI00069646C7|nr:PREDICTED: TLD domain-containing protein 1 isoform X2 [Chinchilla lanigera]